MRKSYDGIIGLALADAMGVPVEFYSREELRKNPVTSVREYGTYYMPEGCWSDDTSLTIATMDGIIQNTGEINENTYIYIAENFLKYLAKGEYTPTDKIFDIGNTTRMAIMKYAFDGVSPTEAGGNGPSNAGNGALMRILPLAYYAYHNNLSDDEILTIVSDIASITHRLETCIFGSYLYTLFALELLKGSKKEDAYTLIKSRDYSSFAKVTRLEYARILNYDISKVSEKEISSLGKTRPTLEATLWSFLNTTSYDEAILKAINLGEDTDTIAACTGGLAGLYYGADSINKEWLSKLKKHDYLKNMCKKYDKAIKKQS